jgi:hypothetical protein
MSSQNVLRAGVVLMWVAVLIGIGISVALAGSLPAPLQDWVVGEAQRDLALHEVALAAVGLAVVFMTALASVGLLFLQRWAAYLFLACVVSGVVASVFTGPSVEQGPEGAMYDVANVLSGLVLGLAFFTNALRPHGERVDSARPDSSAPR